MNLKSDSGFSYLDVMIAIIILSTGILALMSGIAGTVIQSRGQEQQLMAKQIATSTLESVMSVKETDPLRLGWPAIGNIGSNLDAAGIPQGIFLNGLLPVRSDAGPDEVLGTADDDGSVLDGFQREVVILDQCDPQRPSANCPTPGTYPVKIRLVEVRVTYVTGSLRNSVRLNTVLTDYSVAN